MEETDDLSIDGIFDLIEFVGGEVLQFPGAPVAVNLDEALAYLEAAARREGK